MEKFIPETYKEVTKNLEPVIEKYDLDKITVESLVRSSIEIEEQSVQPVTAIWSFRNGKTYSTKASNIKVNLKFALSSVFRLKTTLGQRDFWLALAIIYLIVDLFTTATQEIDEISYETIKHWRTGGNGRYHDAPQGQICSCSTPSG